MDEIASTPDPLYNFATTPNPVHDPNANTDLLGNSVNPVLSPVDQVANANRQDTLAEHLAYGLPGVAAAAVDTVGRSVGLFNKDTVSNFMSGIGANDLADYYTRNQQPLSTISDIATFLLPATAGAKAIQSGSWLFKGLEAVGTFDKLPMLQRLFASAGDAAELTQAVRNYDLTAATTKRTIDFISKDPVREQIVSNIYKTGIADSVKKYVGSEIAMYLTMNQSDTLYPQDMKFTDQLLFHIAGLGLTTSIDTLFLRSAIRRSLQRPEIQKAVGDAVNSLGLPIVVSTKNERDFAATVASASAAEQRFTRDTANDIDLRSNANKYSLAWEAQLKTAFEGMQSDGLEGIVSSANQSSAGLETMMEAAKRNPTIPMGVHTFTNIPGSPGLFENLADQLNTMSQKTAIKIDNALKSKNVDIDALQNLTDLKHMYDTYKPIVIDATGDVHQISDYSIHYQNLTDAPRIAKTADTQTEPGFYSVKVKDPYTGKTGEYGINSDLLPLYPNSATPIAKAGQPTPSAFANLTRFQQSVFYALGQKWVENYTPGKRIATNLIQVGENDDPFRLGLIKQVIDQQPAAVKDFQFPIAARGNESQWLQDQWLQQGYKKIFVPMMDRFMAQGDKAFLDPSALPLKLDDIRYALNMPASFLADQHPAFKLFRSLYLQGDRTLEGALGSMDHFQGLMKEEQLPLGSTVPQFSASPGPMAFNNLSPDQMDFLRSGNKINVFGDNFNLPKGKNGDFLPAQLAFIKPQKYDLTKSSMDMYALGRKMDFMSQFGNAPDMINTIAQQIMNSSAFEPAKAVDTLANGQQAAKGYVVQQTMSTRDLSVFTALDMVSNAAENANRKFQQKLWDTHKQAFLDLQGDTANMFDFARFAQSRRYGFELEAEPEPGPNGVRFVLKSAQDNNGVSTHTQRNVSAWQRAFGDIPMPNLSDTDKAYLPDIFATKKAGAFVPLQINQEAFNGVNAFKQISDVLWQHANFFRTLNGYSPLAYQEWHIPPQNLSNKFIKYIINPSLEGNGGAVKTIVTGNTAQELERKMQKPAIQALLLKGGKIESGTDPEMAGIVLDQNDLRNYFNLHDDAFFNMVDMSDGLAQTGPARGVTATPLLEYGNQVLNDMIRGVENQLTMYSRRTISSLFKDEINYARLAEGASDVAASQPKGVTNFGIWKQYYSRLIGVPADTNQIINAEVPLLNKVFGDNAAKIGAAWDSLKAKFHNGNIEGLDFANLKDVFGDHLPFSSAAEFANNTFKVKTPKTFAGFVGALNATTSNLVVRFLEVGNGIMALMGNMVSMPLVMNSLKRTSWDTDETWQARTGFMGGFTGEDYAAPNMMRMMAKSISFLGTPAGQKMIDEARMIGNIKPMMAEGYKTLHAPFEGPIQKSLNKFIDALSMVSDKGEEWSRIWAYSAGYQLAAHNGISNRYDLHNIANLFADNTIANYRTSNKPIAFTGPLGSPLGLFQTYMYNYYGRLFRYIENKDWRGITLNYAMQSAIFGMQSVPGWQQFQHMYSFAYNGSHDITDSLDKTFGNATTDLLLHGTVSNLPRLFGKDGVALYSRGDVNLTHVPAYVSPENMPIVNLASNTYELISHLFDQIRTGGQGGLQQTLETLGTYSINRPLGRIFELASGYAVDQRGAVVNDDTRTAMGIAARVMGMRPLIEQKNIEMSARLDTTDAYRETINERIDNSIRALFRGKPSNEQLDNGIAKAISDHLSAGGSPFSIGDFIRNAAIAAQVTKNERRLLEILHNPSRTNDIIRLVNNMTSINGDQ